MAYDDLTYVFNAESKPRNGLQTPRGEDLAEMIHMFSFLVFVSILIGLTTNVKYIMY